MKRPSDRRLWVSYLLKAASLCITYAHAEGQMFFRFSFIVIVDCAVTYFSRPGLTSEMRTLGQHMHYDIFLKPTLDFSFSIWCSTSSVSSVFSRRSYATLLVPFIRFRGSTDIPYAWKREQIHHYNQMSHMVCASTPTHKSTSLLSKNYCCSQ